MEFHWFGIKSTIASFAFKEIARDSSTVNIETAKKGRFKQILRIVRSLSAKYRPDRYRRDKSVKFGTELP